ncbi:undecaprenyl-phosphate alpha-N-acetylglucosaminyl 1-phosphate transferase [Bacteroidia bacterium]|nr:undecaprenyl-phosphate alpha-N-acetylglucosaminyl 1-phosphate transferase [Bacteroidia bacterium]
MIIPQIILTAWKKKLFDEPDERKVHVSTVPRLAGFSFVPVLIFSLAFTVAISVVFHQELVQVFRPVLVEFCLLVCGLILLYLVGLQDDLIGARYRMKFLIQIVAASFIPISGLWINNLYGLFGIYALSPWIGIPFTVFMVVFIINAINLIDGIDGLASGLSSICLVTAGIFFLLYRHWPFAMLAFSMFGALVLFFYYNVFGQTHRNKKIFMGDTGSLTLGYVLSFLVVELTTMEDGTLLPPKGNMVVAFSTLLVPLFDVCRVILVRMRNKAHLFLPDRNHIHHKFLEMGFTPRRAMVCILCLSFLFCALNTGLVYLVDINLLFLINITAWTGLHLVFNRVLMRRQKGASSLKVEIKETLKVKTGS